MIGNLISSDLTLEEENIRLRAIAMALIDRVEQGQNSTRPFSQFQHAVTMEQQIRARTQDLAETLNLLRVTNARLSVARREAVKARNDLTDALEAMEEGFAMFDDRDFLILSNSRFCAHLPDVRHRIAPGMHFQQYVQVVSDSSALHLPDGQTRAGWAAQRQESHRRQNVNFVVPLIGDRWLQVSEQRMSSGGTAVTQTDVTAMIRAEREEREKLLDVQARMVRATLDHIDQGVCIFDAQQRLVGWNRRLRELTAPPLELITTGTPLRNILVYLGRKRRFAQAGAGARLLRWVAGPSTRPALSLELHPADGAVLRLYAQATPDGGFVISLTDMTAERRAIAEMHRLNETLEARVIARTQELETARDLAERANTSKSRFVASASHDLLQPLNAAKLFMASLRETALLPDQRCLTDRIFSAFDSVEQILGALLDISKFDIGAARSEIEPLDLMQIFSTLQREFSPVAQEKGLILRVHACRVVVESDRVYLKRVLQNLLSNALRYTPQGRVVLGARRMGAHVRLEVWDTGPGIPADKLTAIFQEFTRLDTTGQAGMGLGLAIVEQACVLLDHPLQVRSVPGRGTVFSLTVPVSDGASTAQVAGVSDPDDANPLENLLVLVIENDADVRSAMIGLLESWGASPLEAACLTDAQALIAELGVAPDVILADYHLDAGEDGLDTIARLRARFGPVSSILITADHSAAVSAAAAEAGVLLLHKPLPVARLRRILQQLRLAGDGPGDGLGDGRADTPTAAQPGDQAYWLG